MNSLPRSSVVFVVAFAIGCFGNDETISDSGIDTGPEGSADGGDVDASPADATTDAGEAMADAVAEAANHDGANDAGNADATNEAASTDAAFDAEGTEASDASADGGASPACIGNVTIDFASLQSYFVDKSPCGTAATAGNALDLTRTGSCALLAGGEVLLDPTRWQICGDFDLQVDFELTSFPIPASGYRYASVRPLDPSPSAPARTGMSLERYDISVANSCETTQNYKSWTSDSSDCSGATSVPTTDITGRMRLTRVGATVTSYYLATGDAGKGDAATTDSGGGASWMPLKSQALTSTPWSLELYTAYGGGSDTADQSVAFSNLRITSASAP